MRRLRFCLCVRRLHQQPLNSHAFESLSTSRPRYDSRLHLRLPLAKSNQLYRTFCSRFLSPVAVLGLATRWRLPLNQTWFFPADVAPQVEDALHAARWTLTDSQVDGLLDPLSGESGGGRGVKQSFLTHLETQGEVLEGFVLLALDVSLDHIKVLVDAYNQGQRLVWYRGTLGI